MRRRTCWLPRTYSVTRALARRLPAAGVDLRLLSASLGRAGERSHAPTFFAGLEPSVVEIGRADSSRPTLPYLPSYEDTRAPGERCFARIEDGDLVRGRRLGERKRLVEPSPEDRPQQPERPRRDRRT